MNTLPAKLKPFLLQALQTLFDLWSGLESEASVPSQWLEFCSRLLLIPLFFICSTGLTERAYEHRDLADTTEQTEWWTTWFGAASPAASSSSVSSFGELDRGCVAFHSKRPEEERGGAAAAETGTEEEAKAAVATAGG
jgi:hypothetical protein